MNPISPIAPIRGIADIQSLAGPEKTQKSGDSAFSQVLNEAIRSVEKAQTNASTEVDQLLSGKGGEVHSAVLATERAELQFQLFLQVRNKVMTAYSQIMQVQV